MRDSALYLLMSLILASGCTDRSCLQPVARDSAGIRIVEHSVELLAQLPVQSLGKPELRIGEVEGRPEYEFARVSGVVPLRDGRLAVADGGNYQIRFFDGRGVFEGSVGRAGSGPGEFRSLYTLWPTQGDSVVSYDGSLDRFTVFPTRGGNVRTFLPAPTDDLRYGPLAVFPDGAILGLTVRPLGGIAGNGILVDSSLLLVHNAAGAYLGSIVRSRFMQRWSRSSGDRNLVLGLPLTVSGQYAVAGQHVCLADGDVFEVRCYERAGQLALIVRASPPDRPVTEAIIDSFLVARTRQPLEVARRSRTWQEIPYPKELPAYSDLLGAANGDIWVASYAAPGDTTLEWFRFAGDGQLHARVRVPATFQLHAVTSNAVYGVDQDSLGVAYVTRRSLPQPTQRCRI